MKKSHREAGDREPAKTKAVHGGGDPDVFDEAKAGGKIKKKKETAMHGAKAKHRLDRPGRKMGGRCGADKSPLSSAHKKSGFEPD